MITTINVSYKDWVNSMQLNKKVSFKLTTKEAKTHTGVYTIKTFVTENLVILKELGSKLAFDISLLESAEPKKFVCGRYIAFCFNEKQFIASSNSYLFLVQKIEQHIGGIYIYIFDTMTGELKRIGDNHNSSQTLRREFFSCLIAEKKKNGKR